ncbi:MAG: MopE-related protein, partial [Myxococcota bacterium]
MRCSAALLLCVALGCRPEGPATPSDTAEVTPDTDRPCDEQDWYADGDADGYGDPAVVERACTAPLGTVGNAEDCDDTDPAVSPAGVELCNTTDDDCDGAVDEDAADAATWYADA